MNNKEFIIELSQCTGYNIDSTQKLVRSIVEAIASRFDEGERVEIPDFGYFEVCNRRERIVVNPANGQRMIVPPKLVLVFKSYLSGANHASRLRLRILRFMALRMRRSLTMSCLSMVFLSRAICSFISCHSALNILLSIVF